MKTKNLYLINQESTNFYKIGITKKEPIIRLKELQTGNGNKLLLIKVFETEFSYKLERALHLHFNSKLINSEWFELEEIDITNFESICLLHENNFKCLKSNPFFTHHHNLHK